MLLFAVTLFGNHLWFALPLVISISLVYGATRHEEMQPILHHAAKAGLWILSFMALVFVVLFFLSWRL
ncbi:hypothetical protein [Lignipirellula cremea]|uniref:Uncharacterized protein n=1 Tax=Lignipirellula cremea TaxID=2528010 RepID=A0A518DYM0_9BACT|nr:hypothetical protein [Lignipirellula cremea]QDU96940.1 hypothetical protein Pla8534_47650 [Lignipirellula cremea]